MGPCRSPFVRRREGVREDGGERSFSPPSSTWSLLGRRCSRRPPFARTIPDQSAATATTARCPAALDGARPIRPALADDDVASGVAHRPDLAVLVAHVARLPLLRVELAVAAKVRVRTRGGAAVRDGRVSVGGAILGPLVAF